MAPAHCANARLRPTYLPARTHARPPARMCAHMHARARGTHARHWPRGFAVVVSSSNSSSPPLPKSILVFTNPDMSIITTYKLELCRDFPCLGSWFNVSWGRRHHLYAHALDFCRERTPAEEADTCARPHSQSRMRGMLACVCMQRTSVPRQLSGTSKRTGTACNIRFLHDGMTSNLTVVLYMLGMRHGLQFPAPTL